MSSVAVAQEKAVRIQRTSSFFVQTSIEKAFPLFGPIREMEWAEGWEPQIVYSTGAEVEEHMIFRTQARHAEEDSYLWLITQYRPDNYFIEYTVSTSQRVWFITVTCEPENLRTKVTVTYSYTSLTNEGNRLNEESLRRMFANNLKDWEEAVNYYLTTGKRLELK